MCSANLNYCSAHAHEGTYAVVRFCLDHAVYIFCLQFTWSWLSYIVQLARGPNTLGMLVEAPHFCALSEWLLYTQKCWPPPKNQVYMCLAVSESEKCTLTFFPQSIVLPKTTSQILWFCYRNSNTERTRANPTLAIESTASSSVYLQRIANSLNTRSGKRQSLVKRTTQRAFTSLKHTRFSLERQR